MPRRPSSRPPRPEPDRERSAGPPWILGARGAPLEAPENTLAGLRRALELGLDGFHYDLRACATGEGVLLRDATLSRTTDGAGALKDATPLELFRLDAGGWFGRRFLGEPVPLFEDALEFTAEPGADPPLHLVELHDPALLDLIAARARELRPRLALRVLVAAREHALAARDAGLAAVLLAPEASEEALAFVRDERLAGFATLPGGWRGELWRAELPCERWQVELEEPEDLLRAARLPLFGLSTREPQRALAVRTLARLAPHDDGPYPIGAPELPVALEPASDAGAGGEWSGSWSVAARLRNPFPFPVRAGAQVYVRRGAFEVTGLPARLELAPGEEAELGFQLSGGSWSPGADPLLAALFSWRAGPGRPAGRLLLDAPLRRVRTVAADTVTRRVEMLRESPGQPRATMTVRRRGGELLVSIENAGGLREPVALVHLAGRTLRGSQGLRVRLPADFDAAREGVAFSCGFEGRGGAGAGAGGRGLVLRRWAGGLPDAPGSGSPGRLVPLRRA